MIDICRIKVFQNVRNNEHKDIFVQSMKSLKFKFVTATVYKCITFVSLQLIERPHFSENEHVNE